MSRQVLKDLGLVYFKELSRSEDQLRVESQRILRLLPKVLEDKLDTNLSSFD